LPTFQVRRASIPRVNLVTDSINAGSLYGGVATAIIFAALLAKRHQAAMRVVTLTEPPTRGNVAMILRNSGIDWQQNVTFARADIVDQSWPIDVTSSDLFVTTSWWSTCNVRKAVKPDQIFYLLQEDERMFYPNGDDQLRCRETLSDHELT